MPLARSPPRTSNSTTKGKRPETRSLSRARSQTEETEHPETSTRHNTPAPNIPDSSVVPPNFPKPPLDPQSFVNFSRDNFLESSRDLDPADTTITNITTRRQTHHRSASESSSDNFVMSQSDHITERLKVLSRNHNDVQKFVSDVEKLKDDGSNIARWKLRTERAIFDMTDVADYWSSNSVDPNNPVEVQIDRCAGRVINATISEDLKDVITHHTQSHMALHTIEEMFQQGGRTAQYVIFRSMVFRKFDPCTTDLITFVTQLNKDWERLKSAGFKWEEDAIKAMIVQLCSPVSGEYGMDVLNTTLDARYRTDKSQFSLSEVRANYQNLITTRKTVHENDHIQTLAASFSNTMTPSKWSNSPNQASRTSMSPATSRMRSNQSSGIQSIGPTPPGPIFKTRAQRDNSEAYPLNPPKSAPSEVHQGIWQCFHCADFGHGSESCPLKKKGRSRTAPHFNDWIKCNNNRWYAYKTLYPANQVQARLTQLEEDQPISSPCHTSQVSASTVAWSAESNSVDATPTEYLLDSGATHHEKDV